MIAKRVSSLRGGADDVNSVSSNHPRFHAPPRLSFRNQPISPSLSTPTLLCISENKHT